MNKILLFDDLPRTRMSLFNSLSKYKVEILPCRKIYDAKDYWNDYKNDITAIILDIMMLSTGLDESLRILTQGGLLTGWIWLWYMLNPNNEDPHPAADKLIIIYSAYLEEFDDYIKSDKTNDSEKSFANSIKKIAKGNIERENEVVNILVDKLSLEAKTNYNVSNSIMF